MEADAKRKFQLVLVIALVLAGARTLWIFHERHTDAMPEKPALKERNEDDYVYLRPSHAHDLASARAVLKGNTVWVKAGNTVAFYSLETDGIERKPGVLPPLAELDMKDVKLSSKNMLAIFTFAPSSPAARDTTPIGSLAFSSFCSEKNPCSAPIGMVKNGDATILIDDIFFLTDPHRLYTHWTKERWASIEHHEITEGMSEMQAQAAMGVGRIPESGATGDYGNRTLVFTNPTHADKPVTVRFEDNAAVSVSK